MISKWLQRLRGGDGSSTDSEPAEPSTAPEPPSMPTEPSQTPPPGPGASSEEPAGDEPA